MNKHEEARKTFHELHPEYDTANGGTHIKFDVILNYIKKAEATEQELAELKETNVVIWKDKYIAKVLEHQKDLQELAELKKDNNEFFKLLSYHFLVLPKKSSVEKGKIYSEYKEEMEQFQILKNKLSKGGKD